MGQTDATQLTFIFIDLAGFTALTEAMGDEEAAGVASASPRSRRSASTSKTAS